MGLSRYFAVVKLTMIVKPAPRERTVSPSHVHSVQLSQVKQLLADACHIVNRSGAVRALERDLDVLTEEIAEPWEEPRKGQG